MAPTVSVKLRAYIIGSLLLLVGGYCGLYHLGGMTVLFFAASCFFVLAHHKVTQ